MFRTAIAAACLIGSVAVGIAHADETRSASVFTGNETRVLSPNFVNADCTSGPRPDVRVAGQPANGTIRIEPEPVFVSRPAGDQHAQCNGRKVDGVAVFYKSKDGFVGTDKVVVDVDFQRGTVSEFTILVDVR
jgi:hypothetical protein